MDNKRVGDAISFLRKRAGFTQKDIADRIGISDKAVSKWERGLAFPDISCLIKLSIILDTDTDSLLAGDVAYHDEKWHGVLVLDEVSSGISVETVIFDKPMVYYLLSYFLLVGIRNILIIGSAEELSFIKRQFGDGRRLGIQIVFSNRCITDALCEHREYVDSFNTMLVFGRCFLYGVGQSRFFRKVMENNDKITVVSIPRKTQDQQHSIYFDDKKKVVEVSREKCVKTQYEYSWIPVAFFPPKTIRSAFLNDDCFFYGLKQLEIDGLLYTEVLDRGFVEFPLNTWEDILDASHFVSVLQRVCGMNIYCIDEIAWRRGMISTEELMQNALDSLHSEYSAYIMNLCYSARTKEKILP